MLDLWDCPSRRSSTWTRACTAFMPKHGGAARPAALPTEETARSSPSYASDADLNKAMDGASMAMIDACKAEEGLSRLDAYALPSMAMDCRIAPHKGGEKEVHCLGSEKPSGERYGRTCGARAVAAAQSVRRLAVLAPCCSAPARGRGRVAGLVPTTSDLSEPRAARSRGDRCAVESHDAAGEPIRKRSSRGRPISAGSGCGARRAGRARL